MTDQTKENKELQDPEFLVLEDEKDLLFKHEYDGIYELDNILPPWWVYGFYLTIIFSVVYFIGSEITGALASPEGELAQELAKYEGSSIKIEMRTDKDGLAEGKEIYLATCASCHQKDGGGDIGPNLADHYWVYGNKFEDIVDMVVKGSPPDSKLGGGMPPWGRLLGMRKVVLVSSYVKARLEGSTPANPKKAEGKLYKPEEEDSSSDKAPKKTEKE